MRRALVTGASGLVGSWLVRALIERGDEVVVVQRGDPGLALAGLGVDVLRGDVRDVDVMARAAAGAQLAFHLAGQVLVRAASRSPAATFDVNVRGTWTVLEACLQAGVARVVVASSQEAYGPSEQLPFVERQPLLASTPYGASKAAAEVICGSYWRTYGLPVCITRCANTYGGGDANHSRIVPGALQAAVAGRRPVIQSDGTSRRDFLYVEDAVRAMLMLADAGPSVDGEAFNVGGPQQASVLEVVQMVCEQVGVPFEPLIRSAVASDERYLDCSKLAGCCGWEARWSLAEGIRRTVAWQPRTAAEPTALQDRRAQRLA
ncbi:MAG: NAD-dependent epimerase/dehydratase family protein [Solirubrobacteraceae bacterium]